MNLDMDQAGMRFLIDIWMLILILILILILLLILILVLIRIQGPILM